MSPPWCRHHLGGPLEGGIVTLYAAATLATLGGSTLADRVQGVIAVDAMKSIG